MPVELDCFVDCPSCGTVQPADRPDCADGHGSDCPDRICSVCLTAVFVDPRLVARATRRTPRRAVA
jgi:hypothetical protein